MLRSVEEMEAQVVSVGLGHDELNGLSAVEVLIQQIQGVGLQRLG